MDTAKVSTGAQSYSVGPTGDFPIARPDKIEAAYARILPTTSNPVDWPLDIIESYEDYSSLSLKKFQETDPDKQALSLQVLGYNNHAGYSVRALA